MARKAKVQLELVPPPPVHTDFYAVGLDLSLTGTGIVVLDHDGNVVQQRVVGYELLATATEREIVERYMYHASEVVDSIKRLPERPRVAIEGYAFSKDPKRSSSITKLAELRGVVKSQLWLVFQLVADILTVGEVRRSVLGSGNFPKAGVIDVLHRRGLVFGDQNIADAYVVAEGLRRRASQLKGEGR